MSGPNLDNSQKKSIDLIFPLPTVVTPQDLLPNGITRAYFQIDAKNNTVTCPKGHVATNPTPVNNSLSFRFPNQICAACELRSRCCTGKGGRTIGISAYYYELTEAAHERQKTETFKKDYYRHRSGVEGSLSALIRDHGMRVARYIGQKKRNLQAVLLVALQI